MLSRYKQGGRVPINDRFNNNDKVYFKSTNYYCDDIEFIGNIYDLPNCEYTKKETMFSVVAENKMIRIFTIKDFLEI